LECLDKLMTFYNEASSNKSILLKEIVHRFHNLVKSGYADVCSKICVERLNGIKDVSIFFIARLSDVNSLFTASVFRTFPTL